MTTITAPTPSRNATTPRALGGSEVETALLLLLLGLLGITVGLTLAILFPAWAEVATLF
jgi:hypothetical protein